MFVEVIGGIWAGSLAIITDAAHLLADVSGFGVSLMAMWYSARQSKSHSYSYGYARIETLAALASVLTVWLVTGILVWEAILRIQNPTPVNSLMMVILACIGIVINILLMAVLGVHGHSHDGNHHHDHHHDLNLKGAIIHVIGDSHPVCWRLYWRAAHVVAQRFSRLAHRRPNMYAFICMHSNMEYIKPDTGHW